MIDIIGWVGAICFCICAIPQVITCYKQKHARGLDLSFILLWLLGEICMLLYTLVRVENNGPLLLNYTVNLLCLLILLKYRVFPNDKTK